VLGYGVSYVALKHAVFHLPRQQGQGMLHEVRQFNSRNDPVKANFAYLCISGCLLNTLPGKLFTLWDEVPLLETVLKTIFQNTLKLYHVSLDVRSVKNTWLFRASSNFANSQKLQVNKVDCPFL
jgi:hypothetical protein